MKLGNRCPCPGKSEEPLKYWFYSPAFENLHPESVKGAAFPGTFLSDARDGVATIVEVAF